MLTISAEALKEALAAPFENTDIEWRISATVKDKSRGLAVPYVTNRAIQNRLDSILGVDGWYNDYKPWPNDSQSKKSAQICGISIYFPDTDLWLTKWDGAENSDIEAVKGGLSDSMKRSAVQWGIGRYLYGMTQVWVGLNDRGFIKDDERIKLDQAHNTWVQRIRGRQQPPPQGGTSQQTRGAAQPAPVAATQNTPPPGAAPMPNTPPATPQGQPSAPQQGQQAAPAQPVYYQVTGAMLKPSVNGGQSTSLMLKAPDGSSIQAFRAGVAPELTPGVWLTNVVLSKKNQQGIVFYTLDAYEVYRSQQAA